MTAQEREFGFASLVRCSLDNRNKTSGIIPSALANPSIRTIIKRCAGTFLGQIPASVRLVVLLGTTDVSIAKTQALFSVLFSNYSNINQVAFRAGSALWVYATHPSGGNGHFEEWISGGNDTPSGRKRILALEALTSLR